MEVRTDLLTAWRGVERILGEAVPGSHVVSQGMAPDDVDHYLWTEPSLDDVCGVDVVIFHVEADESDLICDPSGPRWGGPEGGGFLLPGAEPGEVIGRGVEVQPGGVLLRSAAP